MKQFDQPTYSVNHEHAAIYARVQADILQKTTRTRAEAHARGKELVILDQPLDVLTYPPVVQERIAKAMSEVIIAVYGEGYPLPNKHWENNFNDIRAGTLLPYIGFVTPPEITQEAVAHNPLLLLDPRIKPAVVTAIMHTGDGVVEFGRTAANTREFPWFEGGAVTLRRARDFFGHEGMQGSYHTLISDVRASDAHNGNPDSGATQVLMQRLDTRVMMHGPKYNVNGIEPFATVIRPRDLPGMRRANQGRSIYLHSGVFAQEDHGLVHALLTHQLGEDHGVAVETPATPRETHHTHANVDFHGQHIYSQLHIDGDISATTGVGIHDAIKGVDDNGAPVTIVKLNAEDPRSAATQQMLIEQYDFTICGIQPAQQTTYDGGTHETPIQIYLVRLGGQIRNNSHLYAPAFFPTNRHTNENLYGDLHPHLVGLDARIRRTISA